VSSISEERLEKMRSFVLQEPTSTLDFPAQQDLLREVFRLREALETVQLWLPASGGARTDDDWCVWLLIKEALDGETALPHYITGERRERIEHLHSVVNTEYLRGESPRQPTKAT
jgi:hypothetical protein